MLPSIASLILALIPAAHGPDSSLNLLSSSNTCVTNRLYGLGIWTLRGTQYVLLSIAWTGKGTLIHWYMPWRPVARGGWTPLWSFFEADDWRHILVIRGAFLETSSPCKSLSPPCELPMEMPLLLMMGNGSSECIEGALSLAGVWHDGRL